MHLKKLWLTTTALAALACAQQAQADGLYVSVFGGANLVNDESRGGTTFYSSYTSRESYDADTGFVIGGAIGTGLDNWVKGLRVELEAGYRRNDVGGRWSEQTSFYFSSGTVDANLSTFSIMSNVAYDIDAGWKVKPYVMAGAGWARSSFNGALVTTGGNQWGNDFDVENSGFAWQLGAGFNYEVAPGVDVGLGYRYFDGPDHSYFAGKNNISRAQHQNESHAVTVNLTIDTN
jgi:OmpA-OmpF porin, OOP family